MRNKSWKQIESSRNTRLWITSVIIPIGMMAGTIYASSEEVRNSVNRGVKNTFKKIKNTKQNIVSSWKKA